VKKDLEKEVEAVKKLFIISLSSMSFLQKKFLPVPAVGAGKLAKKIINFASRKMQAAQTLDELAFYSDLEEMGRQLLASCYDGNLHASPEDFLTILIKIEYLLAKLEDEESGQ